MGLVEEGEFYVQGHCQVYHGVEEDYGSDVAVPEEGEGPAGGYQNLDGHEEWFVGAGLDYMCREDIDPEEAVDEAAVDHKEDKAGNEECPGVFGEFAGKECAELEYSVEHEGFGNAVADTEYQYSEDIKLAAAVGGGMGVDPGVNSDNKERCCQEYCAPGVKFPVEGENILFEKEKAYKKCKRPIGINHHWYR